MKKKKQLSFLLIRLFSQLDEGHLHYQGNFFNLKSAGGSVNHIYKLSPRQHLD